MFRNPIQRESRRSARRSWRRAWLASGLLAVLPSGVVAQTDPADRLPAELREQFVPRVEPLANEDRVVRSAWFDALPGGAGWRAKARRWWEARGGVVLDLDEPGLVLHFYAEGIKKMTLADKLWEGLPERADSLQALMDAVIGRARETGRPVQHLIVAGHAGLPGCSALGGQVADCTFRGVLSTYQRQQLARLRPYLAPGAEIELRQCGTGSGKEGQRLLTAIYETTGAATSSYLADFHFGDANNHPRVRVGAEGFEILGVDD